MRSRPRVLARRREEPAAAAHLRHRVAEPRRSSRRYSTGWPRPSGATTASSARARPVLLPRRDRLGPGGLPPQGRRHAQGDGGLLAAAARSRPATSSSTPRTSPRPSCSRPPATSTGYADGMFPPMHLDEERDADGSVAPAGPGLLPQADELPDAQPDLPVARAVLPRAAAAAVRVRQRLPLREVRRRARADPGARHDPGRRAHLLHAASRCEDELKTCSTFVLDLLRDYGLERLLPRAVDQRPGQVHRRPTRTGTRRPRRSRRWRPSPASSSCPTRAVRRSTGRRSPSRPGTPSAAPGRCRPSSSTSICRERFGLEYTGRRRHPPAAGDDPPGAVRLDRAVLRRAHRALRRRVPALAGAGAGGRHPGRRGVRRLPAPRSRRRLRARASGSRSTTPTTGCRRRSATRRSRRCRSC